MEKLLMNELLVTVAKNIYISCISQVFFGGAAANAEKEAKFGFP